MSGFAGRQAGAGHVVRVAPPAVRKALIGASSVGAFGVAFLAFAMSFDALAQLAKAAGIRESIAWMWPVVVDGSMIVATAAALVLRTSPSAATRIYPWAQLALFALISVVGNVLHSLAEQTLQLPPLVAGAVSGVPPIALLLSTHLLVMMLPPWRWALDEVLEGIGNEPTGSAELATTEPLTAASGVSSVGELEVSQEHRRFEARSVQLVADGAPGAVLSHGSEPSEELHGSLNHEPSDGPAQGTDREPVAEVKDEPVRRGSATPGSASDDLMDWLKDREAAGEPVSGQIVAEHLQVSLSTGKRRLKAAREALKKENVA